MDKIIKQIHNCETNEIVLIPLNAEELAQLEIDKISSQNRRAAKETKAAAKEAAQAKLAAIGLTVEDLQALGL